MNNKNCQQCNQSNPSDMKFCLNCGAEILQADDLPATVFGGFPTNPQAAQTQPNYQPQPNFQQPNFHPQQTNFQQPNFQQPNFQTAPAESGGNMTKIFVGIGGALIGLIFLASGGVQLYKAFNNSSSSTPINTSTTPQNFYSNTANTSDTAKSTTTPAVSGLTGYTRQTVGKWSLRDKTVGDPEKDGFSGATEENQLKYYDSENNFLHVTMAEFPSIFDAQRNLRQQFQKFRNLNLRTTPENPVDDNDGNEIGIMQTMTSANGKIYTIYWTRKNVLIRVLGERKDVEDFFSAY